MSVKVALLLCALVAVVACGLPAKFSAPPKMIPVPASDEDIKILGGDCTCTTDECYCCGHVTISEFHLKDAPYCLNLTYVPAELAIDVLFEFDGMVLFNKSWSAEDPDICVTVPYVHVASVCIGFYNMSFSKQGVSGCAQFQAKIFGKTIFHYDIGCFNIGDPFLEGRKRELGNGKQERRPVVAIH